MLIPKSNLKLVYQQLFTDGVLVVKKDVRATKHDLIAVPNLEVMKALNSLKSRGFVTEQFCWQYHYYYLTDEGILFLRGYLHLPESVMPLTLMKKAGSAGASEGQREERRPRRQEGGEYRREWRNRPAATA